MDGKNTKIIAAIAVVVIVVIAAIGIGLAVSNNNDKKDPPVPPVTENAYVSVTHFEGPWGMLYIKDIDGKDVALWGGASCTLSPSGKTTIFMKNGENDWTWNQSKGVFENAEYTVKVTSDKGSVDAVAGAKNPTYTFTYERGLGYHLSVDIHLK